MGPHVKVFNMENIEEKPVLVVTDCDGYLVQVGDPKSASKSTIGTFAHKGYTIKTMKLREYRALNLIWIYDKPKQQNFFP